MRKKLVIINGVTGAIGTACLARFSREFGVTMYGLSRKARAFSLFAHDGHLPDNSLICSIGDITDRDGCRAFVETIDAALYDEIVYVHAVGLYQFEIDASGTIKIAHDDDGDGIDDRVMALSYNAFFAMADALRSTGKPIRALIFGGIADKYRPAVHTSWWSAMEKIRDAMKRMASNEAHMRFIILNISSVICPHEMLTRPFVFQHTNANPRFWLMPHEVAEETAALTLSGSDTGFIERNLFHKSDYYENDYFSDEKFTARKKAELGITSGE